MGRYPCTWGQLNMWREMEWAGDPAHGNVIGGGFLRAGYPVEKVLRGLGDLVQRHESLRTRFHPTADRQLRTEVIGEGTVDVELRQLDGDPVAVAKDWLTDFEAEPYDLAGGVPFRARVGLAGGEPRLVMLGTPHVSADFLACRVLFGELVAGLDGRDAAAVGSLQPADKAAQERSAAGQRTLRRSLDYWRQAVAGGPAACFTGPARPPESPRYRSGAITSRRLPPALHRLARRHQIGTSQLLLAAVAALIGRYTGQCRCLIRLVVSNRGRPELRNAVGTLSQEAVAVLDLRAQHFADLARSAWLSSLRAMRHGQYDPDLAAQIVTRAGAELDVYFNDMWTAARHDWPSRGYQGPPRCPAETTFEWTGTLERASVRFYLEALEVLDDPGALQLSLLTDTAYVPSAVIPEFLLATEELLTTLARGDAVPMAEIKLSHRLPR